jgi:hypothetical protein
MLSTWRFWSCFRSPLLINMAILEIASQAGLYPACHDMATMKKPAEIQKRCPVAQAGRGFR